MIDLKPAHLAEVKRILQEYAPGCEVRVFGSRLNRTAGKNSDLDLVLVGKGLLDWHMLEVIKDAFATSDLPFMVDVLDWHALSKSFREIIEKQYEVLYKPGNCLEVKGETAAAKTDDTNQGGT
ncbi:MAG: nucleotidyltransferase domain-containing protein [Deltaproteobacteria bacterium]|nr:nucleotidyltransferase domain-containing protein [Deltaproteobacteria bacterium]